MKTKKINKYNLFAMLMLVMALLIPQWGWAQTTSKPAVGDGTMGNPFQISTYEELSWFRDWVNGTYSPIEAEKVVAHTSACAKLTEDIDMKNELWTPIGIDYKTCYAGVFDGNSKKISNLYVNGDSYVGLFAAMNSSIIRNLIIEKANVIGRTSCAGILAGMTRITKISGVRILDSKVNCPEITGGIVGNFSDSQLANCEIHVQVEGNEYVGGVTGNSIRNCIYENVFSMSSVSCRKTNGGLLFGSIREDANTKVAGLVAYSNEANFILNGTEQHGDDIKAIGIGTLKAGFVLGFSNEELKSGVVAYILQQKNNTGNVVWGQKLSSEEGDTYPVLGSTYQVYTKDDVTISCQGKIFFSKTFTNIKDTDEGMMKTRHGTSQYIEGTPATCTTSGILEHYECNICHSAFFDNVLEREMVDVTDYVKNHNYDINDVCITCHNPIPTLAIGSNSIQLVEAGIDESKISGYNLYKFTPKISGLLNINTSENCNFALWNSKKTERLQYNSTSQNFLCVVTANLDYYIGVKYFNNKPDSESSNCTLNIDLTEKPSDLAGDGSANDPFILKNAEHLKFFADYVNGTAPVTSTHDNACAKIANDVENIDMSSICHAANDDYNTEINWIPIGNLGVKWRGEFDGNGMSISNLYVKGNQNQVGLFGYVWGSIKNLTIKNATVINNASQSESGILMGYTYGATIQNIVIDSKSSINAGECTGAIAGNANRTNFYNCINYAKVIGTNKVGGIAGFTEYNTLSNVFGYGDVIANEEKSGGIIVGQFSKTSSKGVVAYSKEATLTINGTQVEAKATGSGSLSSTAYSKDEVKSGKLAYALNNGVTDGSQVWYQKLGEDGDAYLTMKSTGENVVYHGTKCNKITDVYTNDNSIFGEDGAIPHKGYRMATEPDANGIYSDVCLECGSQKEGVKYIKDFCGETGKNLKLTVGADGSYSTGESVVLSDKVEYNSPVDFEVADFTYIRNNPHTEWQVYYVPFEIECSELVNAGITAAYINNFHEYTKNGETEVVLEVKEITSGTLKANVPYVIKAATSGETQIHTNNVMLHKAEAKALNCQSVTHDYSFKGIYKALSGFNQDENINNGIIDYTLTGGKFLELSKTATLSPMRWYLTICDRNKATETSSAQSARVSSIQIKVVGEGEATGIENIHVITDGNVSVNQGIYDLQGRRLSAEPAHGVYIKNGKKIIK